MAVFNDNDNKAILWDILSEQKLFEGIDLKYRYEIKDAFEQTILVVEKQGRGLSLIEKNKEVIKNMVSIIDTFKRQQQTQNLVQRQYTNEELHEERQKAFERELKRKQTEFDGLNRTIPEKIDFSDKLDEKIGDKMDMLLSEAIASRERELKQVLEIQNPETASKWVENNDFGLKNMIEPDNSGQSNLPHINLKIGDDAQIQESQIVNLDKNFKKIERINRVSFNDEENKILNYSNDSSPLSINTKRENQGKIKNINEIIKTNDNDIEKNFFKMLKKEEPDSSNEMNFQLNKIDKKEQETINSNIIENNIRMDIDNLKKELQETNKSIEIMNKSIDSINSKQEEIVFILKTMLNGGRITNTLPLN